MKILGLRCSNSDYTYVILEGERKAATILVAETVKYPKNQKRPDILVWFLLEIEKIINSHKPDGILIKRAELRPGVTDADIERIETEGIAILAARRKAISYVVAKRKRTIAKDIGYKGTSEDFEKAFRDNAVDLSCIKNDSEKIKDAILVARSGMR